MNEKRPRRPGRPRGDGERYSEVLNVPVTPSLRRQLEGQAEAAGYVSLAAFVRETKLGASRPRPIAHPA